jgi:hypothetical protein
MILALQALPLLLLIGLLFSGRVAAVPAVLAALLAAIPAAFVSLPSNIALPDFLGEQMLRGAYLALQPMGVVLAGLLFHAAVSEAEASKDAQAATPRRIFIATLLAGCFLESVTGFGVGAVFALASLRVMGIIGAPAGAMALLAPWMSPYDPIATSWGAIRKAPSAAHWFGTDEIGRDVLSRVIWGTQASLLAGVVSVSISLLIGVPIGMLAGWRPHHPLSRLAMGVSVMAMILTSTSRVFPF